MSVTCPPVEVAIAGTTVRVTLGSRTGTYTLRQLQQAVELYRRRLWFGAVVGKLLEGDGELRTIDAITIVHAARYAVDHNLNLGT